MNSPVRNDDHTPSTVPPLETAPPVDRTIPALFTTLPPIKDPLSTSTSRIQDETAGKCLPHHSQPPPLLSRAAHIEFLETHLHEACYIAYDASRPWVIYWCLTGLSLLGQDVEQYRRRVVETFAPAQNPGGGFGGGHGHLSHCAPSYAVVLSLAMVGGEEGLEAVDRRGLWRWLGQVKRSDGGFGMCVEGEEDVRGAYCAMVMISLLALPLELPPDAPARAQGLTSFLDGLPEYLSRCQTFEGGISGAPQTEAHGAYAFCALACLCILGPPHEMLPRYIDMPLLLSWLSSRQYAPEGGFSGRTNKLVDGCYSHWVGGCWPIIEAALPGSHSDPIPSVDLYSRDGLIRYILSCCQSESGGLRDKPSTRPDAYHSCYTMAGLSSAQYKNSFEGRGMGKSAYPLDFALRWSSKLRPGVAEGERGGQTSRAADTLAPIHPIYVIPWPAAERTHSYFAAKLGFT